MTDRSNANMWRRRALYLEAALQDIISTPCSQVNDSESLRHTIKTIRTIAQEAIDGDTK
jgi:hypothetical protein